jgi:uncharacterized membrane protein YeaQ/YmgE (transglycosylase-associated protein family)
VSLIWCLLTGVAVGCLLGYVIKASGCSVFGDIAVGAVGAFLGVFTCGPLVIRLGSSARMLIGSAIAATIGTVILSVLLRLFKHPVTEGGVMASPIIRLGLRSVLLGSLVAVAGSFPAAALVALVFRFPIPFDQIRSGPEAVLPALVAVLFYGALFGGFLLLAALGAVGGLVACFIGKLDVKRTLRFTLTFALLVDFLATLTLAVLDKIIGPW